MFKYYFNFDSFSKNEHIQRKRTMRPKDSKRKFAKSGTVFFRQEFRVSGKVFWKRKVRTKVYGWVLNSKAWGIYTILTLKKVGIIFQHRWFLKIIFLVTRKNYLLIFAFVFVTAKCKINFLMMKLKTMTPMTWWWRNWVLKQS